MKKQLHNLLLTLLVFAFGMLASNAYAAGNPPSVTAFTTPTYSTSTTVSITTFTATDTDNATSSYLITTSAATPATSSPNWSTTTPTTTTAGGTGARTFWAWAMDEQYNISAGGVMSTTTVDTSWPEISAFSMPATATSTTVNITNFTATDTISGVAYYLITETSATPTLSNPNWAATTSSFTFASTGTSTAYAWVKDAAGNISTSSSSTIFIDISRPTVALTVTPNSNAWVNPIVVSASDNTGIAGYIVNESATTPAQNDSNWTTTAPTYYTVSAIGSHTLYAWVKDTVGNITSTTAPLTVTPAGNPPASQNVTSGGGGSSSPVATTVTPSTTTVTTNPTSSATTSTTATNNTSNSGAQTTTGGSQTTVTPAELLNQLKTQLAALMVEYEKLTVVLKSGSKGDYVKQVQLKLQDLGFFPKTVNANGVYGPTTKTSVIKFQKKNKIQQTGTVGPVTRTALGL